MTTAEPKLPAADRAVRHTENPSLVWDAVTADN